MEILIINKVCIPNKVKQYEEAEINVLCTVMFKVLPSREILL